MDLRTGEVSTFETAEAFAAEQERRRRLGEKPLVALGCLPKPTCSKCFGRGYVGRNALTGDVVPCRCVRAGAPRRGIGTVKLARE